MDSIPVSVVKSGLQKFSDLNQQTGEILNAASENIKNPNTLTGALMGAVTSRKDKTDSKNGGKKTKNKRSKKHVKSKKSTISRKRTRRVRRKRSHRK